MHSKHSETYSWLVCLCDRETVVRTAMLPVFRQM